ADRLRRVGHGLHEFADHDALERVESDQQAEQDHHRDDDDDQALALLGPRGSCVCVHECQCFAAWLASESCASPSQLPPSAAYSAAVSARREARAEISAMRACWYWRSADSRVR